MADALFSKVISSKVYRAALQVDALGAGQQAVKVIEADAELRCWSWSSHDGSETSDEDGDAELHVDCCLVSAGGIKG